MKGFDKKYNDCSDMLNKCKADLVKFNARARARPAVAQPPLEEPRGGKARRGQTRTGTREALEDAERARARRQPAQSPDRRSRAERNRRAKHGHGRAAYLH